MALYKNRYRTESMRLSRWDYSWPANYFITICTKNRFPFFGEIRNGIMGLNEIGLIAHQEWEKSAELRPDMHLTLGAFVVMPDHFHAILTIGQNEFNRHQYPLQGRHTSESSDEQKYTSLNAFGPQRKNLASVIRGYKGAVTRAARLINPAFAWQTLYHESIIRDSRGYQFVELYILNNPRNWKKKRRG